MTDDKGEGEVDGGADAGGCDERAFFRDTDGDTWGDDADSTAACSQPEGFVERGGDCAPADVAVHPTATEVCNGTDDDCANGPDDPFACVAGTSEACATSCDTTGTQACTLDCTPGTCVPPSEVCNYIDDDCDGLVDPGMQEELGPPVRMTAASSGVYEPRIA